MKRNRIGSAASAVIELLEVRSMLHSAIGGGVGVDTPSDHLHGGPLLVEEGESAAGVAHSGSDPVANDAPARPVPPGAKKIKVSVEHMGNVTEAYSLGDHGHDGGGTILISEGESIYIVTEHHTGSGHPNDGNGTTDDTHYYAETGDSHHFVWSDQQTNSADTIDVFYDFRALNGYTNSITAAEQTMAERALQDWEEATLGRLNFVRSTTSPNSQTIIIGKGDLAATNSTTYTVNTLGLGGGTFAHGSSTHSITFGMAWMASSKTWDTTVGNGNPAGTFDFYTVAAQEIGHALGLGHTDNLSSNDAMDGSYDGEITTLSSADVQHVQTLYSPLQGGTLRAFGSTAADTISVSQSGSTITVNYNGISSSYAAGSISDMYLDGGAGNDNISVATTITRVATIAGASGNDTLSGGAADDVIGGGDGNDSLKGNGGDDLIEGYGGNDTIIGGAGIDRMFGNDNDDLFDAIDSIADGIISGGTGSDGAYMDDLDDDPGVITFSVGRL